MSELPPAEHAQRWFHLFRRELQMRITKVVAVDEGWDCMVYEVNDEWIVRVPRRPEIEALLRKEVSLLAVLAPTLSVSVPRLRLVADADVCIVVYQKIIGTRIDGAIAVGADQELLAEQVGRFLAELHRFPRGHAIAAGLPSVNMSEWVAGQRTFQAQCEREVYPFLDGSERRRAAAMFDGHLSALADDLELRLVHADFGPAHILCNGSRLSGVIDWSDAQLGDPAIDFGWPLHGLGARFAATLRAAYDDAGGSADDAIRARALFYHRLGPWYEVLYGLQQREQRFVETGLVGVRARLPT